MIPRFKNRARRARGAALWVSVLVLGLALVGPGPARPAGVSTDVSTDGAPGLPALTAELRGEIIGALARGGDSPVAFSLTAGPGGLDRAVERIVREGGRVLARSDAAGYLAAEAPARAVGSLVGLPGVQGLDRVAPASLPAGVVNPARNPVLGSFPGLDATGAPKVRPLPGGDGRGVLIALIDTGADPGHSDLYLGSDGGFKLVDWADFSGEGDVPAPQTLRADGGRLEGLGYPVPVGLSRSGNYRFGYFRESQVNPRGNLKGDVNRNGVKGEIFGVLVYDAITPGVYDSAIVDGNNNLDFTDDRPMGVFKSTGDSSWFGDRAPGTPENQRVNFVLTRVASDGSSLNLGFDGHGHGTQTAAVAAANPLDPGRTPGVAPGAKILIIKALDSSGDGSWANISRAMIYAAERGAQVVSLSVAGPADRSGGGSSESLLISRLSRIHNVLFVIASGNEGPALGSSLAPGDPVDSLTVGSYFTPAMWREFYGYPIPSDTVNEFSAAGPRKDGGLAPSLVAPGSSVAAVPFWQAEGGRTLVDGTSVAAPHAAGAAAVLWSAASARGSAPSFRQVKRLLEGGARALSGYSAAEQGHGAVDLEASFGLLGGLTVDQAVEVSAGPGQARGVFATGFRPGRFPARLNGVWGTNLDLKLISTVPWLVLDRLGLSLPASGERTLSLDYRLPDAPGLYSGLLFGDDPSFFGREAELLSTVVVPYRFSAGDGFRQRLAGRLEAARMTRYFFEVPPGIDRMVLSLKVPQDRNGSPIGGLRVRLTPPDRRGTLGPLAVGAAAAQGNQSLKYQVSQPDAGIWEVSLYCPPETALQGLAATEYDLEMSLTGVVFPGGTVRLGASSGETGPVSLRVKAAAAGSPISGRIVASGFGRLSTAGFKETLTLAGGESQIRFFPDVGPDAVALKVRAETSDPGSVEVSLWNFDSGTGQWREVPISAEYRLTAHDFEIPPPQPGRYLVLVSVRGFNGSAVTVDLEQEVVADSGDIQPVSPTLSLSPGQSREVELRANLPSILGRYYGRVSVIDESEGRTIGSVPVILDRAQPEIYLKARPAPGDSGTVMIEIREAAGHRLVETWVKLGGATHWAQGGRLRLRPAGLNLPGLGQGLRAEVNDRRYRYWEGTLDAAPSVAPVDDPEQDRLGREFESLSRIN